MSQIGMGQGPFNGGGDLKSVTDAVRDVLSQSQRQIELPKAVSQNHIDNAAQDVEQNAHTLEDRNKIITQHMQKIDPGEGQEFTNSNVTAFQNEVLKRINQR